jgi:hypothetical protein
VNINRILGPVDLSQFSRDSLHHALAPHLGGDLVYCQRIGVTHGDDSRHRQAATPLEHERPAPGGEEPCWSSIEGSESWRIPRLTYSLTSFTIGA